MLKPFTESCSLRRKSPLHLPVPQMTERKLEGKQKKFRWNSMEWKRSNMIQHVVFSDFFDEKKLDSFCKSQRMKQAFLSGETWTWQRETLAKTNPRAARPHAAVQIERLQFDKHEATLAAQIPCNDIKPDDPVWYHLDRFSKKIMISTTVLNLDITNYGPKNADGFTSMIFTSPVPSPKQQEHFYMCSPNASTFEEAIHLEECNPCEIPGFVLQLDLDFLLDLAKKKRPSFHDMIYIYIFHY